MTGSVAENDGRYGHSHGKSHSFSRSDHARVTTHRWYATDDMVAITRRPVPVFHASLFRAPTGITRDLLTPSSRWPRGGIDHQRRPEMGDAANGVGFDGIATGSTRPAGPGDAKHESMSCIVHSTTWI